MHALSKLRIDFLARQLHCAVAITYLEIAVLTAKHDVEYDSARLAARQIFQGLRPDQAGGGPTAEALLENIEAGIIHVQDHNIRIARIGFGGEAHAGIVSIVLQPIKDIKIIQSEDQQRCA